MGSSNSSVKSFLFGALMVMALVTVGNSILGLESAAADSSIKSPTNIFVKIAKEQSPAVVNISTTQKVKRAPHKGMKDEQLEEFYKRYLPPQYRPPKEQERHSLGSGFVVDKDGYILTNNHVIGDADEIVVTFVNGNGNSKRAREYQAKVVGADPKTDIALIKIEPDKDLPVLALGDSSALQVGEWVVAIGNPFGLSGTVTVGVVSAKGRDIGAGPYDDFIQTDASINQGNSGGPLLNTQGQVIGINTIIMSPGYGKGNIGIGFAIPINAVKAIYNDLKDGGKVSRGWLGVRIQPVTPQLKEAFNLPSEDGALIGDVFEDTPAAKSGIKRGDVIVRFDNNKVETPSDLSRLVGANKPGHDAKITLYRGGNKQVMTITLGEIPIEGEKVVKEEKEPVGGNLGLAVADVPESIAKQLRMANGSGVIVTGVSPDGPAAKAGIRARDIILEIKQSAVNGVDGFNKIISSLKPSEGVAILLKRGTATQFLFLQVP